MHLYVYGYDAISPYITDGRVRILKKPHAAPKRKYFRNSKFESRRTARAASPEPSNRRRDGSRRVIIIRHEFRDNSSFRRSVCVFPVNRGTLNSACISKNRRLPRARELWTRERRGQEYVPGYGEFRVSER